MCNDSTIYIEAMLPSCQGPITILAHLGAVQEKKIKLHRSNPTRDSNPESST